ncbi:MAG TPA: AmmeMemoRadiSam system protein A [Opitutaceae bacterium]|nr:AmmeMemoRadiSam system protein A [Opitutaceae bacterium]
MNAETPLRRGVTPLAVLLPHAPILVPAVAGSRQQACRATVAAMREAARRVVAARPETVVLVSPHAPREGHAFGVTAGNLAGSLAPFGARRASVRFPGDPELSGVLRSVAAVRDLPTARLLATALDHGSVVPLWFLAEAGWDGPTVVVALAGNDNSRIGELGECVAVAAKRLGRRVAVVASGDMSHRLQPGAPCGYDPQAVDFDAAFIHQLRLGATHRLAEAVAPLQERAAEDVVEPTLFALGATGWCAEGREVLGYEGPFGVGYGVAVLSAVADPPAEVGIAAVENRQRQLAELPAVARAAIATALGLPGDLGEPRIGDCPGPNGVFVTLHTAGGQLRGCIGTLASRTGDLAAETWRMAREAALADPRFPPVTTDELGALHIEVTVLGPLEEIDSADALDPQRWGVVVRAADGRRGLLLPDIPEVATVARQLEIARAKARIGADEPVRLQRFSAQRIEEAVRA